MDARMLCLLAAGTFFLSGLLTGWWKYRCMATSVDATAPFYVDTAHRASLMYAFSALLLREFVPYSPLSPAPTLLAVAAPLAFFGSAILIYIVHGLLRDTDNQLRKPYKLGGGTMPAVLLHGFLWALAIGEIGGFVVLFWGAIQSALNHVSG